MPDLLTPLYELNERRNNACQDSSINFRKPLAPEKSIIRDWVALHFSEGWACELETAMSCQPVTAWIAVRGNAILGFACYDATARGFFGPIGIAAKERGNGTGARLLYLTLESMREAGYAYAVIGGAGSLGFYQKHINCLEIPNSEPGIYRGLLKP